MEKLIKRCCDASAPSVDAVALKTLKRTVRNNDDGLRCAHEILMKTMQSSRASAATRARAVTTTSELFERSRLFRELTLDRLEVLMKYTIGTDDDIPLPDVPKGEGDRLRQHAIDVLEAWEAKFKTQYKQLTLARKFVTERLGDDAPEARAERAQRLTAEKEREVQSKLQNRWLAIKTELPALLDEIDDARNAACECFRLLFGDRFVTEFNDESSFASKDRSASTSTTVNDTIQSMREDECEDDWEDVVDGAVKDWRFAQGTDEHTTASSSVTSIELRETSENAPIIEQLRGLYRSTKARYLPRLTETLQILGRIQPENKDEDGNVVITQTERSRVVNAVSEFKQTFSAFVERCEALRLIKRRQTGDEPANANAKESSPTAADPPHAVEEDEDDIESRRGASSRAVEALLERAAKRRKRGSNDARRAKEEAAKRDVDRDGERRSQKMLASEIKAHNDEVLAEAGLDFFELERRRQNAASETLASDLMEEEIERHNELTARGATPRQRIERSLKELKRGGRNR